MTIKEVIMARWIYYTKDDDSKVEDEERKERAQARRLFYKRSDWISSGPRWIVRFWFKNDKGDEFAWIPTWDSISRMFKVSALIEARNSKRTYDFFRDAASLAFKVPEAINECEHAITELLKEEEGETLPWE